LRKNLDTFRIPIIDGSVNGKYPVKIQRKIINNKVTNEVQIPNSLFEKITNNEFGNMAIKIPAFTDDTNINNNNIVSRFLAKMALESFAERLVSIEGSLDEIIEDKQYDIIRNHARLGTTPDWPCSIRRIYDIKKQWKSIDGSLDQIIHESDFLFSCINDTNIEIRGEIHSELYFVVILWGMEFAINMGGASIEGYEQWLKEHDNISPLYYGKNKGVFVSRF
jgi:hypothetical protein